MGMEFKLEQIAPRRLDDFVRHPAKAYEYILSNLFESPAIRDFMEMVAHHQGPYPPKPKKPPPIGEPVAAHVGANRGGALKLFAKKLANPKGTKQLGPSLNSSSPERIGTQCTTY